MRERISQLGAVLAMALAVLGAVPAGAAAAGWVLPATPLAASADGPSGAVVAVAPGGDAVAAWTGFGAGEQTLLVATRPAGGPWSAPQTLAASTGVDAPAVAIDATGDATVLWVESEDGLSYAARAARRPAAGGSWSAPHDLPPAGTAQPLTQLRAGAGGDVIAVWVEYDAGEAVYLVRGAVWSGGAWGAPATLSDAGQVSVSYGRPQIAPDAAGGPLLAWTAQQVEAPFDFAIQTATFADGAWSAPLDIEPSAESLSPVRLVGVDGGGAAASWFAGSPTRLWGALRAGAGPWTVDDVSLDVAPACEPLQALGADAGGGATVVWRAESTGGLESVRLAAGGWEELPQTVFAARSEVAHDAAIERGTVVFVAADVGTNAYSLLAVRPAAGGGWAAPALLAGAPAGRDLAQPELAADASGNVLAAWTATDGLGGKSVAAAGFQASGPQLSAVTVPASGTAGEALAVSAVARSAFASVAQVTWDFGDGSPLAAGAAAAHAYAQPGTYTVTVAAVDGVGNASAARRTVTIAPAAAPPVDPPVDPPGGGDPPAGGGDPPGGGNGDPPPAPAALARPALGVRGGVLRLPRRSRSVRLAARNRDAVALRGVAQLVRPRSGRRAALTLARMRGLVLASGGRRSVVRLRLSTAALRALRRAPGQRLRVRVVLRLRAADGRRVAVARTVTLDGAARFAPARRPAAARIAC